mgnify:CR=1 FL=1
MRKEKKRHRLACRYLLGLLCIVCTGCFVLTGCADLESPRIPAGPQVWRPAGSRTSAGNLSAYWAENGPTELREQITEVDSLLQLPELIQSSVVHWGWYSVSPGRWGALVYARLPVGPTWETLGATVTLHETYQGHRISAVERSGRAPVFQTQWKGWLMWAWQPSLLQDALLAQKKGGIPLPNDFFWQQELPFSAGPVAFSFAAQDTAAYSATTSTPLGLGIAPPADLSLLPDFLTEGYFFSGHPTPYGRQDLWFAAAKESFLWVADTSRAMGEWWEEQFTVKGEIAGYTHQGLKVRQLLDNSWELAGMPVAADRFRNPFVVRLPGGWLLGSDRVGVNRWIDYVLAGRLYSRKTLTEVLGGGISGWVTGGVPWLQQWSSRTGIDLRQQWTQLLWTEDTLRLYPLAEIDTGPDLVWQYDVLTGPVRNVWHQADGILIEDQAHLTYLSAAGSLRWRVALEQPLQSEVMRIAEAERVVWVFHTSQQIVALDESGRLLPGFPYTVPVGPIRGWVAMRGSDGYARFFWQEPAGRIQGVTSRLQPCRGWPVQAGDQVLSGHLQSAEADVFYLLGPERWTGRDLRGDVLWSIEAPAPARSVVSAKEQLLVQLTTDEWGLLSRRGTYRTLASDVLEVHATGDWLFVRRSRDVAAGYFPQEDGDFYARYRLSEQMDQLLAGAAASQIFFGGSRNHNWYIYTPEGTPLAGSPVPSQTRPALWISEGYVQVATNQSDRVVAYRWPTSIN